MRRCMVSQTESPSVPDYTSIRVTEELADELHSRKSRGDSYEDVIWSMIDELEEDSDDGGGD